MNALKNSTMSSIVRRKQNSLRREQAAEIVELALVESDDILKKNLIANLN